MYKFDLADGTANSKKHFFISLDPQHVLSDAALENGNGHHNSVLQTTIGSRASTSDSVLQSN